MLFLTNLKLKMAEDFSSKSFYKSADMNVDNQVSILTALLKYKPVGVSRHFLMVCIQDIVNSEILSNGGGSAAKDILLSCDQIWNFLNSLYDLKALEHSEPLPFPNENSEFQLPIGKNCVTSYDKVIVCCFKGQRRL